MSGLVPSLRNLVLLQAICMPNGSQVFHRAELPCSAKDEYARVVNER